MNSELHEYVRHAFTLTVTWYTWFVALNYGALAWLAAKFEPAKGRFWGVLVAFLFLSHNVLGIGWLWLLRGFMADLTKTEAAAHIPSNLYRTGSLLMMITLALISVGWAIFIVHPPKVHEVRQQED